MSFRLTLPIFDGPFDLLLHLIKIDEVDITEVSLAAVTDRYMEILRMMQDLDLEVAGDYLVVAASLLEIKSRALLPEVELPEEEDDLEEDPRHELIDQIIEYRKYRELSESLGQRAEVEAGVYFRTFREAVEADTVDQFVEVNLYDLLKAFERVLEYAAKPAFREVVDDEVHIEDCMAQIRAQLEQHKSLRLVELIGDRPSRKRVIGMFLALLELIRLGEIFARHGADRLDLRIVWRPPEERPFYSRLDENAPAFEPSAPPSPSPQAPKEA